MIGQEEKKAIIKLLPFLNTNPNIIDVGSNKGGFSDIILDEFGDKCKIHLFEPVEILLNYTKIKYEYKDNIIYNNLIAYDQKTELDFFYFENRNNELSSIYDAGDEWNGLPKKNKKIKAVRIDDYTDDYIDYLKIDCEGSDLKVLHGCEKLLQQDKIGVIQIEYSSHWKRAGSHFDDLIELCNKYGYTIYRYEEGIENFWECKQNGLPYDNYFITKHNIHNYSIGWNNEFVKNTLDLGKFDFVLEIGSFEGLTTKYICENLLENGRIICVDPMEDYYTPSDTEHKHIFKQQYQRFLGNTRGLNVELRKQKSKDALPKMNAFRFGFIYVDGDHSEESVYFDAVWSFAVCKIGGYILFDDYEWREETKRGIDSFLNEFGTNMQIVIKGYQVLIKKTGNQYNNLTYDYYK